ncbi:hypothetical protein LY90DRAFT_71908 [Neocallimastix californiae]|uniref:Chondroitin proteoglycan 4 domain-containing protein n=1 Tax=Neocallimastix californiae TaxID=1754190 RepID=A0A1Y2BEN8_9FUNG|nr:hypothetical protein LY90DRAFT_71908 [Neocallimastix californiae]|eukprot:ORY33302.1 hypothetical protein LY90DRAFT_71908 [Neocallimastix californiae]
MKILSLFSSIFGILCISLGVKGHKSHNGINEFINTLDSIIDFSPSSPFNMVIAASVANMNDTIKGYEDLFNSSKDECMRGCYAYCIHMLEISTNRQCNSKFHQINEEYKKNKPCYKVNQDMQSLLDHGNAYLDLFCSRTEDDKDSCPFISNIVKMQKDTSSLKKTCGIKSLNRTQCENTLVNNLSIMIDAEKKIKDKNITYASGGNSITLTTPQYNLTKIEEDMKNSTCLIDIQPPQQIMVNANSTKKNDTASNHESSQAVLGQSMNVLLALMTVVLTALLF